MVVARGCGPNVDLDRTGATAASSAIATRQDESLNIGFLLSVEANAWLTRDDVQRLFAVLLMPLSLTGVDGSMVDDAWSLESAIASVLGKKLTRYLTNITDDL